MLIVFKNCHKNTKNQIKPTILQVNVCYFGNFQMKIEDFP